MNSLFKILQGQLHLYDMERDMGGWAYCNCHPETCPHENGLRYVGKKEPFKLEGWHLEEYNKVLNDKNYQTSENAERLLKQNGVKYSLNVDDFIVVADERLNCANIQIEEYKYIKFYKVDEIIKTILNNRS